MRKPIDELTIKDLKKYPIWEWALEDEDSAEDETWVEPNKDRNFTEEVNGSLVLANVTIEGEGNFPAMCNLEIEGSRAVISSIVYYKEEDDEYIHVEDVVRSIKLPLTINIELKINGTNKELVFLASKIDIFKNQITTNIDWKKLAI